MTPLFWSHFRLVSVQAREWRLFWVPSQITSGDIWIEVGELLLLDLTAAFNMVDCDLLTQHLPDVAFSMHPLVDLVQGFGLGCHQYVDEM